MAFPRIELNDKCFILCKTRKLGRVGASDSSPYTMHNVLKGSFWFPSFFRSSNDEKLRTENAARCQIVRDIAEDMWETADERLKELSREEELLEDMFKKIQCFAGILSDVTETRFKDMKAKDALPKDFWEETQDEANELILWSQASYRNSCYTQLYLGIIVLPLFLGECTLIYEPTKIAIFHGESKFRFGSLDQIAF